MKHIMKNHVYNYVNVIKRQQKECPIGLDLTGGIAQVYMIWWNRELKRRLTKCYVDDVNYGFLQLHQD